MKSNKTSKTVKTLAMIPASGLAVSGNVFSPADQVELPKGLKKLNLPPMIKPDQVPVGSIVSGEIIALANSISNRADMRESKLIHLRHDSGTEFLFPLTGVIKKAIGGDDGVTANVGKKLFIKRNADTETTKYGGVKKVFQFDVYLEN